MKLSIYILFAAALLLTACEESEREIAQQQEYETQLRQQVIETDESFRADVANLLDTYFALKDTLVESNAEEAVTLASDLVQNAEAVDVSGLNEESAMVWASFADIIVASGNRLLEQTDIDDQRIYFEDISEAMIQGVDIFRPVGYEVYVQSCPMVRSGSADWLSREENIRNPYHGDRMLRCGEVLRQI